MEKIIIRPIQIHGKGWDVEAKTPDNKIRMLCAGRAPYTLAQAQAAAAAARRDISRHGIESLDFS